MNCKIETYENNCMSLSCHGSMTIKDGIITELSFKGMPRSYGDCWTNFYTSSQIGGSVSKEQIDIILKYNGSNNVISEKTDE